MCKWVFILLFLALFGSSANQVAGQATVNTRPTLTNGKNSKDGVRAERIDSPASTDRTTEANRFYQEGMKLLEDSQFSQAADSFQQAIRLDTKYADAYSGLGRAYFKMREWQKSINALQRAAELHAKQRDEVPAQKPPVQKREESNTSEKSKVSSPQGSPTQTTNANSRDLKPLSSTSTNAGTQQRPKDVAPPVKPVVKPPENKQTAVNIKPADTKATSSTPNSTTTQQRQQEGGAPLNTSRVQQPTNTNPGKTQPTDTQARQADGVAQMRTVSTNPTNKQPAANANAISVQTPRAGTETQPRQPDGAAPMRSVSTNPDSKQQGANPNAGGLKTQNTAGETTSRQQDISAPGRTVSSNPDSKQQGANANAAGAKTQKTTRETQQAPQPVNAPTKAAVTAPDSKETTNANVATLKTPASPPGTTQKAGQPTGSASALKTANPSEQKPNAADAMTAINLPPQPQPSEATAVAPTPTNTPSNDIPLTQIYRVGPNDVLDVHLNDSQSEKSTLFTVTPSGLLEYPMLTEPVPVSGLTVEEIGARIEDELRKRALVENPKVIVGVRDYTSHTILVSGLVKDAGTKILRREAIPLYVVVADAQPLPEAARVTLIRNELHQVFDIDLMQAADMNLLVRPADVITLHPNQTQFVYIGGEVKNPGEKTFRRGLTLTQAIITAGGMTQKSRVARIGRDDGRGFLVETVFNLNEIATGKAVDPVLRPGDRIMIVR